MTPVLTYIDDFMRERPCSPATELARRTAIKNLPFKTIESVSKREAGKYVSDLLASGLSAVTVNNRVSCLRVYWNYLSDKAAVDSNPWLTASVKRDRRFARQRRGSGIWAYDEVAKMLTELRSAEMCDLAEMLAYSGCRVGELADLQVKSVTEDGFKILQGKTESATRTIYLPKRLALKLQKRCADLTPEDYVYCRDIRSESLGVRGRAGVVDKRISRALAERFPEYQTETRRTALKTAHGLRKFWSTVAENERIPESLIKACVGHKRQELVFAVYSAGPSADLVREVFLKVAERIDSELSAL
jgi:integrase